MEGLITLSHGAGGAQMNKLIKNIFRKHFDNPSLTADDAAVLKFDFGKLAFTTDGFIVSPAFFLGGDIGRLSVCGTVNDLACMGAEPLYLSCSFIIEEGFPLESLELVAKSMAAAASEAGIKIVAGDTKVAGRGQCDGIFITTSGIGRVAKGVNISGAGARPGDAVIVTGDIGRHGCAVLLSRGEYGISADVKSDCAPLWGVVSSMLSASDKIHAIRDATRGGVGTVLHEIAEQSGVGIRIDGKALPVSGAVAGVCGMLGLEPLYLACEGRLLVFAPESEAAKLLEALKNEEYSRGSALIGEATGEYPGRVVIKTEVGGQTLLSPPAGELLPRIC
jgi:hydrogenase expression/formation protein HypE